MQHAEATAAVAEAKGSRTFRLEMKTRVVERQFRQALAQVFVVVGVDGEEATEDHGDGGAESRQRNLGRPPIFGQCIANLAVGNGFNAGSDIANLARPKLARLNALRSEDPNAVDLMDGAGRHHPDFHVLFQRAFENADKGHDAEILVVPGIDQHGFEWSGRVARFRWRQSFDQRFKHVLDAFAGFGGNVDGQLAVEANDLFDLLADAIRFRRRQVDFIQDRDDLMVRVDGEIGIGERLRLNALTGIDQEQRAFTGGQAAAHFVGEIDVARRVHQV